MNSLQCSHSEGLNIKGGYFIIIKMLRLMEKEDSLNSWIYAIPVLVNLVKKMGLKCGPPHVQCISQKYCL